MKTTTLVIVAGCLALSLMGVMLNRQAISKAEAADAPQPILAALFEGRLKLVDLGYALNAANAFWPAENYEQFTLKTIATFEKNGVLSKSFCSPEHLGTHLDAPNHFAREEFDVARIRPSDLFAPGVVIDLWGAVSQDADYRLSRADVEAWELRHGRIPDGAVVLLNTGWGRYWNQLARYQNKDLHGVLHFPGYSVEAARFLVDERHVKGVGVDTMSIDHGPARDFPVHKVVNGAGRYGLENLTNLDQLPASGFYLVVAPMKIDSGSGGPTRVFAVVP